MFIGVCFAYMCVWVRVSEDLELEYRQMWASKWVLGIEVWSSGRVASALNPWAISLDQELIFLITRKKQKLSSNNSQRKLPETSDFIILTCLRFWMKSAIQIFLKYRNRDYCNIFSVKLSFLQISGYFLLGLMSPLKTGRAGSSRAAGWRTPREEKMEEDKPAVPRNSTVDFLGSS